MKPCRTAVAALSGLIAGVTLTVGIIGGIPDSLPGSLLLPLAVRVTPLTVALIIGASVLRRWLTDYSKDVRRELTASSEERRALAKEINARLREISRREDALNRSSVAAEARIQAADRALADEREARAKLEAEHAELAEDYNRVVTDALQQSAEFFTRRSGPHTVVRRGASPAGSQVPVREDEAGTADGGGTPRYPSATTVPAHPPLG